MLESAKVSSSEVLRILMQLTSSDNHSQHLIICTFVSPHLQITAVRQLPNNCKHVEMFCSVNDDFLMLQTHICHLLVPFLQHVSRQIQEVHLCPNCKFVTLIQVITAQLCITMKQGELGTAVHQ